jgi:Ras-related protein Rab-1A
LFLSQIHIFSVFFKILLIGDLGVGKSCVILRYVEGDFPGNIMSSIGVDFKTKQIDLDDRLIKLQIWDTAGHEKFRTITTSYYKSAHAIIILYDITQKASFDHIRNWITEIDKFGKQGVLKVIVGNKLDMENNRKITKEAAENLALKYGIKLWEVSAKDNTNIEEMFLDTIKTLLEKNSKIISEGSSMVTNIHLNKNVKNKKNKKCC